MRRTTPTTSTSSSGGVESSSEDTDGSEEVLLSEAGAEHIQLKRIKKMTEKEQQALLLNTIQKGTVEPEDRRWLKFDLLPCVPVRYVLAVVSCLGFINVYALRVNLSVAIVQMANSTATPRNGSAKIFNWTSAEEGQILAAFFYGYIITQIPGGLLAQKIGGRWVFGIGIAMTAVLTLLTPIAAYTRVELLILVRALEGFFEGVTFPAMHVLWSQWAPPMERSRLATISYAGPHIGTVLSFPLSGLLVHYGFAGGWPSVFYVFGAVGLLWFLLWLPVGYSSPATHPRISKQERSFIESAIAAEGTATKVATPWMDILLSPAVWGIIIAHFCNNWGFYTLLTCMPTYLKQAVNLKQLKSASIIMAGVFSAIPYTLLALLVVVSGQLADFMRKYISTTIVRKIMTSVAAFGGAVFLLFCGYFGTTTFSAVSLLTVAVGLQGCALAGFNINHLDIAPRFSGLLMGISNMVATIPGIVGPIVAKAIAHEPSSPKGSEGYYSTLRDEWRQVFFISAEVYIFGLITYLVLGSGVKQYWADGAPSNHGKSKNFVTKQRK